MSDDSGWKNPRLNEDMQFAVTEGGPVHYAYRTEKAVEYVVVANDDGVIGYLWACDADDAAGWQERPAAGDDAYNAGVWWALELRKAKARGLSPSRALAELAGLSGGGLAGEVVPGSRAYANSLTALRELAGDVERKQVSPSPPARDPQIRRNFDA